MAAGDSTGLVAVAEQRVGTARRRTGPLMADRIAAFDWAATPLGPRAGWPPSLAVAVDLMAASGHAMCLAWGPERTLLYNDAYAPILGARHPAALGAGFALAWPDVWPEVEALVERTFRGETSTFQDMRLVLTRNGHAEETWWSFSYSPVRDESGGVGGLLNVTLETTGRVLAERERDEAVRRSRRNEERLAALVAASSDRVFEIGADLAELRPLGGRDRPGDTGGAPGRRTDPDLFEADRPAFLEAIARAAASRAPFELEHRIRRADGGPGWAVSRAVPVAGGPGAPGGWFGMTTDVTARHEAEAALRASEAFNRSVLASTTDCIKVLDLDGRLTFMSERGQEAMEVGDFGAIALCPWPEFWSGAGNAAAETAVAEARLGRASSFVAPARTMAGNDRWWHVAVSPILNAAGEPERILSVSRDITALRASQAQREHYVRLIEHSGDLIGMAGPDGALSFLNAAGRRLAGLASEADGVRLDALLEPEPGGIEAILAAAARDGRWTGERSLRDARSGASIAMHCTLFPVRDADGAPIGCGIVARDMREQKRAEERQAIVNAEISHRLKNTLAMVQSIATTTLRASLPPEELARFTERLQALARAHDLLQRDAWDASDLASLVAGVLENAAVLERCDAAGPAVRLGARAAMSTSLLLHELATNAVKYGALSAEGGRVRIGWRIEALAGERSLVLEWSERGGPPVGAPTRRGFGTRLVSLGLLGTGGAELRFERDGLAATFRADAGRVETA